MCELQGLDTDGYTESAVVRVDGRRNELHIAPAYGSKRWSGELSTAVPRLKRF